MRAIASQPARPRLTRSGGVRIATVLLTLALTAAIFFGAAGTIAVSRAWLYYGGLLASLIAGMAVIFVRFPAAIETVNARGKLNPDVKRWDKVFGLVYTLLLLVQPAVAGLDAGRLRLGTVPAWLAGPALGVTVLAYAFVHWAMIVNTHAETGVRIQTDRHHEVVSVGPYRFVRHPFYVAIILVQLLYPLAVGSWLAYAPGLLIAGLFVWRTAREDATLRRELAGYQDYARRTRYRLVPGVW